VPPIGLLYLLGPLERAGHEAHLLDLCFADDPAAALSAAIAKVRPLAVGITIRQIDTALYRRSGFFLDDVRDLVAVARGAGVPVVAGGAGFSFLPREVLRHTGADFGVEGPGEGALPVLLARIEKGLEPGRILRGRDFEWRDAPHTEDGGIGWGRYLAEGAVGGFETQKGCMGTCVFCPEGGQEILFRDPACVAEEVAAHAARGVASFHLCDSEFNQDLGHCGRVLEVMAQRAKGIEWALYMKPEPHSPRLFSLLAAAGAKTITLSLETPGLRAETEDSLRRFFASASGNGIAVAVDLLAGFPGEREETVRKALDLLASMKPPLVNVNAWFRVFPGTRLTATILSDARLRRGLVRPPGQTVEVLSPADMLRPVFWNGVEEGKIREWIRDLPGFVVEAEQAGVNYQKLRRSSSLSPLPPSGGRG
jgi:radical SAM superfamily enzyme YgiQ (UPF0313 family)